jgi:hypothetical protein
MEVIRRAEVVVKDGEIWLTGLPYRRGETVEVIILPPLRRMPVYARLTARALRQSGVIGMWKDRTDIEDSSAYARRLREQSQQRRESG